MKKPFNRKLYAGVMLSYVFVLFIPLIIGGISQNIVINSVEKDILESNISVLDQTKQIMDKWMYEAEKMAKQLAFNTDVNSLVYVDESNNPSYNYQLKRLLDNLIPYRIKSDIIHSFYIYFKQTNFIVTPNTVYRVPLFYQTSIKNDKLKYADFIQLLEEETRGKYVSNFVLNENYSEIPTIAYAQSITTGYNEPPKGTILVLVDEREIKRLLENLNLGDNGWFYIVDENDNIMTSLMMEENRGQVIDLPDQEQGYQEMILHNEKMVVSYVTSSFNGWKYITVTPADIVMSKVQMIKRSTGLFISFSLLVGILIAGYLASHNIKPLQQVVTKMKEFTGGDSGGGAGNAYEYLENTISQLVNTNTYFKEMMDKQIPMMYASFFDKLFNGQFNSTKEINAFSSHVKVNLEADQYVVLIVRMYNREHLIEEIIDENVVQEMGMSKIIIKEILKEQLGNSGYIYDIDETQVAVLMVRRQKQREQFDGEIQNVIQKTYQQFLSQCNMSTFFAVGDIYTDILNIARSYQEALQVLENKVIQKGTNAVWYKDLPEQNEVYYYPPDIRQRLFNLAKSGEEADTKTLLAHLYHENFERRHLSPDMYQQLIFEIRGTLIHLGMNIDSQKEMQEMIANIDCSKVLDEVWCFVNKAFQMVCKKVNEQKRSHNVELKTNIIKYIHEAYGNSSLSRYDVAARFGLTEGYLSHFFKEQTGETFSSYLENVRIRHACELLEDPGKTIADISEQVGYNNVQSFRRAFKRVKGVSPSTMR